MASLLKLSMKKFYENCSSLGLLYFKSLGNRRKYSGFKKIQLISPYIIIILFGRES